MGEVFFTETLKNPPFYTQNPRPKERDHMNINLLQKEKDMMEIEVTGENDTLLAPLLTELLADDKVDFATYRRSHLQLDNPVLVVRVVEGKPQMALKRAAKALANEFKEFREKI